jgi:hypothetical protein
MVRITTNSEGQGYTRDPHAGGGCATCHFFAGWRASVIDRMGIAHVIYGATAFCAKSERVVVDAAGGCHHWEREVGSDDHL